VAACRIRGNTGDQLPKNANHITNAKSNTQNNKKPYIDDGCRKCKKTTKGYLLSGEACTLQTYWRGYVPEDEDISEFVVYY